MILMSFMNIFKKIDCGEIQRAWKYISDVDKINEQIEHNTTVYECMLQNKQMTTGLYVHTIHTTVEIEANKIKVNK